MVRAYNSATGQLKTTKTEDGRAVPMHPTLAKIIATWRLSHWSRLYGRQPTPDDLVVPTRNLTPIDASDAVYAFKADLAALGLRVEAGERRDRGGHDLRGWYKTRCIEDGADADHPAHDACAAARRERGLRAVHMGDDLPRGEQTSRGHPRRGGAVACYQSCYHRAKGSEALEKSSDPNGT